jgi:peptidyl-prolyl cis-trans isomerase D
MFDYVQNNRKLVQIFLALIMLPFAFFGIESFVSQGSGADTVATVGSSRITQQELQQALRQQQDRLRQQFGREMPAGMFDNPEFRRAVLDSLIVERVLALHATDARLMVSDAQLGEAIQSIPAFEQDGKFSRKFYDAYVASQGMSSAEFERRLRQSLIQQQMLMVVRGGMGVERIAAERWATLQLTTREIAAVDLQPESYVAQAKLTADAVNKYYEANRKRFETPEQVRVEYLVLGQDALAAQITVSDKEITDWYQAHLGNYKQAEERQASHILIGVARDADQNAVKAAQARATELLSQLRKTPADFGKLARQHSQDPGSAARDGDLGWFARGAMVKSFEEAAFALKQGEISDVVRSDFGFHIIQLTGIKAEQTRPLEQVKNEIAADLKRQAATRKYAESAEGFSNTVYEQADSLAPAAEKYHLTIAQSPWLDRQGGAAPLNHAKLLAALFATDAIKNKRNTEAVEVAPNTLVAARVIEHKPATQLALEAVRADIEKLLLREEAARLARKEGETLLAQLGKGGAPALKWGTVRDVSRAQANGLSPEALRAVFTADVSKLPSYAGVVLPAGGYALYRIDRVKPYVGGSADEQSNKLRQQYAQIVAEEEFSAWIAALRSKYEVKINQAALEGKEQP